MLGMMGNGNEHVDPKLKAPGERRHQHEDDAAGFTNRTSRQKSTDRFRDLKFMKKEQYLRKGGYTIMNYFE